MYFMDAGSIFLNSQVQYASAHNQIQEFSPTFRNSFTICTSLDSTRTHKQSEFKYLNRNPPQ